MSTIIQTPDFIKAVAHAYESAPIIAPEAYRFWDALADETAEHYNRIAQCMSIGRTSNPEPYPDAAAMLRDIAQGHIWVSTANCEHPLWSDEVNIQFRVVHDVLGHGTTGAGFTWGGEYKAYEKHLEHTHCVHARMALFTEAVGQVAYALLNGGFGVQKCAILPSWMQWPNIRDTN